MQAQTQPSGKLLITSGSGWLDWVLPLGAALCAIPSLRGAIQGTFRLDEATSLIGSVFFLIAFAAAFERTRFEIDPSLGAVRWSRRKMWGTQGGTLPFSRVKSVVLQTSLGSTETAPAYRLAFVLDRGELPLTSAYAAGALGEYESIAARIRALLQLSPSGSDLWLDSVRAALTHDRKIEAIKLVRLHRGLPLTEAKQVVDQLEQGHEPLLPTTK